MTDLHPLRCSCGAVEGTVDWSAGFNRCVCYCKDCQAFAHVLGRADEILDPQGGSDIVQIEPGRLTFTAGREHLACLRLTAKGLLRWHTTCCNTPIGNTMASYKLSFVGVLHCCVTGPGAPSLDEILGPPRVVSMTKFAHGDPKPRQFGIASALARMGSMLLRARVWGRYRQTPFFDDAGVPVVTPRVLSDHERVEAMARADANERR